MAGSRVPRRRPMQVEELPSWVLARRLGDLAPLSELARRWQRESERLGEESEDIADFVAWVAGLGQHPPGRPRGSADRHPDATMRRSQAQRRRRRAEVTAAA